MHSSIVYVLVSSLIISSCLVMIIFITSYYQRAKHIQYGETTTAAHWVVVYLAISALLIHIWFIVVNISLVG